MRTRTPQTCCFQNCLSRQTEILLQNLEASKNWDKFNIDKCKVYISFVEISNQKNIGLVISQSSILPSWSKIEKIHPYFMIPNFSDYE